VVEEDASSLIHAPSSFPPPRLYPFGDVLSRLSWVSWGFFLVLFDLILIVIILLSLGGVGFGSNT
jgi:hypothetical protein